MYIHIYIYTHNSHLAHLGRAAGVAVDPVLRHEGVHVRLYYAILYYYYYYTITILDDTILCYTLLYYAILHYSTPAAGRGPCSSAAPRGRARRGPGCTCPALSARARPRSPGWPRSHPGVCRLRRARTAALSVIITIIIVGVVVSSW